MGLTTVQRYCAACDCQNNMAQCFIHIILYTTIPVYVYIAVVVFCFFFTVALSVLLMLSCFYVAVLCTNK